MNKSVIMKIAGILAGSFLVITVATFFLYPYLNEENYEQIQNERLEKKSAVDEGISAGTAETSLARLDFLSDGLGTSEEFDQMLQGKIDSLLVENSELKAELDSVKNEMALLEESLREESAYADGERIGGEMVNASDEQQEEFSERVKSLLNLDEDELKPIANQMSQSELVRIYRSSGNLHREKLLRSLSAERAAKLMREIML